MHERLVIEQFAEDIARLEAELVSKRRDYAELIADLAFENAGLRELLQSLCKGARVERDELRATLERFTSEMVARP